eukprot:TRINITY_DN39931_c0_g1_i1.p1 TRINITY_DN39931_c0_g1~~TRINITY_DN39931_c0_g1_i1.p1  ORF type:complete len:266 (+),score=72.36 TRINITY_DN39931_c0_g1_i1:117-914(+)
MRKHGLLASSAGSRAAQLLLALAVFAASVDVAWAKQAASHVAVGHRPETPPPLRKQPALTQHAAAAHSGAPAVTASASVQKTSSSGAAASSAEKHLSDAERQRLQTLAATVAAKQNEPVGPGKEDADRLRLLEKTIQRHGHNDTQPRAAPKQTVQPQGQQQKAVDKHAEERRSSNLTAALPKNATLGTKGRRKRAPTSFSGVSWFLKLAILAIAAALSLQGLWYSWTGRSLRTPASGAAADYGTDYSMTKRVRLPYSRAAGHRVV